VYQYQFARGDAIRAALAPDASKMAIVTRAKMVELWDCKTWTMTLPEGQTLLPVRSLAFTPDGKTLITSSELPQRKMVEVYGFKLEARCQFRAAGLLRFWDPSSGAERSSFYDASRGEEEGSLEGPLTVAPPELLALSPDGHVLAAGGGDGSVFLWDRSAAGGLTPRRLFINPEEASKRILPLENFRRTHHIGATNFRDSLVSLAFSPDGRLLATVGTLGYMAVWKVEDRQKLSQYQLGPEDPLWVAFSPGGDLVIPRGGALQFLHPGGGEHFTLRRKGESPPVCVAFSTRANRVAVAYKDNHIVLWDLTSREPVGGELIGHLDRVSALAFSPDGKTLASGSHDRRVKLWSVPAASEVASLEAHQGGVFCLAFSPDGTVLASGGGVPSGWGEVYLWRAPRP
jgi:WD40 repeat protein